MAKVRTFSRFFPKGHPKQGQPTFFVEKFWKGLETIGYSEPPYFFSEVHGLSSVISGEAYNHATPKLHTIRAGKHFKAGDYFSPRVWSDKPYSSKQVIIAPDIKIKKVWDIDIEVGKTFWFFKLNGIDISNGKEDFNIDEFTETLAKNDGLELSDFLNWFPKSFSGQIICWSDNVEY